jgi:hypothetical protein
MYPKKSENQINTRDSIILACPTPNSTFSSPDFPNGKNIPSPFEVLYSRSFLQTDLLLDLEAYYLTQCDISIGITTKAIHEYQHANSSKPYPVEKSVNHSLRLGN